MEISSEIINELTCAAIDNVWIAHVSLCALAKVSTPFCGVEVLAVAVVAAAGGGRQSTWHSVRPGQHLARPITPDGPIKNQRGTSVSNSVAEAAVSRAFEVLSAELVPEIKAFSSIRRCVHIG